MPRPDEEASENLIERERQGDQKLKTGLKTAGNLALTAAGAAGFSKIAPFLNEYIPQDLAMKGISKVSPKLGNILSQGMNSGLSLQSGLDFLKDNMGEKKPENQGSGKPNILDQYSPELKSYIEEKINQGYSPTKAALSAQGESKFKSAIEKLKNDHKLEKNFGFFDLIKSIYDTGLAQGESQEENTQQPEQPQQTGGQGQQMLMSMLQKINQKLGA